MKSAKIIYFEDYAILKFCNFYKKHPYNYKTETMAGEGSMMGAIQSLKNNRALRKNDRNKWKELIGTKENPTEDHIKASPELLLEIKTRLQKRNRINKIIQIISVILFFAIFACIIFYLENNP